MDTIVHTQKNVEVFGFGISLFVPLVIMVRALELHVGLLLIAMVVMLFVALARIPTSRIAYFAALIGVSAVVALLVWCGAVSVSARACWAFSAVILAITLVRPGLLTPLYDGWMAVAHLIGDVIFKGLLVVLFYGVFGVVGCILRLFKKDPLQRVRDRSQRSYWIARESTPLAKETYTRQF